MTSLACDRVVVITDSSSPYAQLMTRTLLSAAQHEKDFSIVAVVDTRTVGTFAFVLSCMRWLMVRMLNPTNRKPPPRSPRGLRTTCREFAVPYQAVGRSDPNELDVPANLVVSVYCLRKFSAAFLAKFDFAVNYHNGRLPAYRGVLATNWELYRREPTFGFSFHRISEKIDEGNILVAGSVSADRKAFKYQVETLKTHAAAKCWPEVIVKMKRRDAGMVQSGPAGNYTRRKLRAVREIGDPTSIDSSDLERRIRCFELVHMNVRGRTLPVSAVQASSGGSRLDFVTADGAMLRATRFDHLPYSLHMLGRLWRRLRR